MSDLMIDDTASYILTMGFWLQTLIIIGAVGASFLIRRLMSQTLFCDKEGNINMLGRAFDMIAPVFRPLLSIVIIAAGQAFYIAYYDTDDRAIQLGYELMILWVVTRLVRLSTDSKPILWFVVLIGMMIVGLSFTNNIDQFITFLNRFSFNIGTYRFSIVGIVKGVIALGILMWAAGISMRVIRFFVGRFTKLRTSNRELAVKISQILIYFALFMVALDIMGIDLTALAVFGGAVGVGLGFGLQKITSNFISGLILLMEKTVEVGDFVELENGLYGHIRHIGARYTMIETRDTKEVMVPNEEFIISKVTNWTYTNPTGRMEVIIGVSYETEDMELAQKLMIEASLEHPRILHKPAPRALMHEFGASSVDFRLMFWLNDVSYQYWPVKSDVLMTVWKKFKEHNIQIPFPQRDLHMQSISDDVVNKIANAVAGHTIKPAAHTKQSKTHQTKKKEN